ncbi:unnamed protein product [Saimiriine gammaherpesvirus 2]|uniref:Envelope glycoprotein L n=1 Tax=Saimiriine herpesvirus 2 (strain 11) TaxID=10383 RepID=GL_SHV21|nr:unnamed protein product [Saimiriine gammaherpesvirus 2]Q01031.1 RecName: Full=Envelope glycoprotein L; Short=gL; Flags: Precursor [Herpesvirus saimiri (strain 11)]pir/I36810/ hypothetical protein ORF47 - saimiriine herpesvirus 1 (strain 11) [Saimiriine alphaherpesvirus 1]CAA45670.1 unnamed protein product [Saimiriine gammaherpesvirus 2]
MKWLLGAYVCLCLANILNALIPNPCCNVFALNETLIPSIYDINWIYITDPQTCKGVSVAQVFQRRTAQHMSTRYVCSNGFNVISFLLAVLRKLPLNTEEYNFKNRLITLQNSFLSKLGPDTTSAIKFKSKYGQLAKTRNLE